MKLEAERIRLREFREEDYLFFCNLERDEHTIQYEADSPPSQERLYESYSRMMEGYKQPERIRYVFLVERKADDVPVGKVIIWQIDKAIDEWELGWAIHRDNIGKGYASEAARALIRFGFSKLGANRICANCNADNLASERVMQKIGMTKEGVLRETRILRGGRYDSCIYSVLLREYSGIMD